MLRKDDLQNGLFLWQDPEAFCFGIDAVLLAHFPEIREGEKVCDLGCGFGPVPMILYGANREVEGLHVTGLEIQEEIADTARRSVRDNSLADKIRIVTGDIREASSIFGAASFSLVTTNPPYMAAKDGLVPEDPRRAYAKMELLCTAEDVIRESAKLLRPRGRLAMIHRPYRLPELMVLMRKYHLEPKRMRFVHSLPDEEPAMVLIEAVRGGKPYLRVMPPLIVYDGHGGYTEEVLGIYGGNLRV